jgi:hypothetical protein
MGHGDHDSEKRYRILTLAGVPLRFAPEKPGNACNTHDPQHQYIPDVIDYL